MSQDAKMILVVVIGVLGAVCGLAYLGARSLESSGDASRRAEPAAMPEPVLAFAPERAAMPPADAGPTGPGLPGPGLIQHAPAGADGVSEATVLKAAPEDPVQRGLKAYREGRYGVAAEAFGSLAEEGDRRSWIRYMAALSLWKAGEAERAADLMRQVTAEDPSNVRAWVNQARILNDLGQPDEALETARTAAELDPEDADARFLIARSLFNLGRVDEAQEVLDGLLEAHPDHAYAWNLAGLAALKQGRYEQAADAFLRARKLAPGLAFVHNNLGMALELQGRRREAAEAYAKALEVDPSHTKAAHNLERLGAAAGSEPEVARADGGIE